MQLLKLLGQGLSLVGGAQTALPNMLLDKVGLPHFTSPLDMFGQALTQGKKFQFGREYGNNLKDLGIASAAYFGAPAAASLVGGSGGGAAAAAPAAAAPAATPSLTSSITKSFLTSAASQAGSKLFTNPQQPQDTINPMPRRPITIAQSYGVNPGVPQQYGSLADNPVVRSFLRY